MSPYDHPQYFEFIDQMRAAPDDDLPRLMCSDWLEEQGEEAHARFIRRQVEFPEESTTSEIPRIAIPDPHWAMAEWNRGFINSVTLPSPLWIENHELILKRNPVRSVTLSCATWRQGGFVYKNPEGHFNDDLFFDAGGSTVISLTYNEFAMWPGIVFTFARRGLR